MTERERRGRNHLRLLGRAALGSVALLVAGYALANCVAEVPGPALCGGDARCASGEACVLGRCRGSASAPVPAEAERVVLPPLAIAKVSEHDQGARGADADVIVLGDEREGETLLLLRFSPKLSAGAKLVMAVLVLEPMAACRARPGIIELGLSQVLSPWSGATPRWSRKPELSLPMRAPAFSSTPARPLRIEVTALVAEWLEHPSRYYGLGLTASATGPGSACFASGRRAGLGPRLELYVTPAPPKGGPVDAGQHDAADAADAQPEAGQGGAGGSEPGADGGGGASS